MTTVSADAPFHVQLEAMAPTLRALARSLTRNAAHADDLTQDTLMKAWANRDRYTQGTNLRAWLFTIMRNAFYSDMRKKSREVEDADGAMSARLASRPTQDHVMAMRDFESALATIAPDQREALILVGAAGLSYEEAAEICGCAVGTVKSRVNRARVRLAEILKVSDGADMTSDGLMDAAMGAVSTSAS